MSKKAIALLMAGCMVGSMVAPAGTGIRSFRDKDHIPEY